MYVRSTTVEYSDSEDVDKHGYPDFPPKTSKWDGVSETYIFCSNKPSTYIVYDKQKKNLLELSHLTKNGTTSGATEGIGNLYAYGFVIMAKSQNIKLTLNLMGQRLS